MGARASHRRDSLYRRVDASVPVWTRLDLNDTDPAWTYVVAMGRLTRYVATPLGLIEAIGVGDGEVVSVQDLSTTYRLPTGVRALLRARADVSAEEVTEPPEVDALWTVGRDGLPEEVREMHDMLRPIRFHAWGATPEVTAPPADHVVSEKDWIIAGMT